MTVGELRNWLRDFDPDMEVRIGMYQDRGSNFAYEIDDIEVKGVSHFYDEDTNCVCLIEGGQCGIIGETFDEEEEEV